MQSKILMLFVLSSVLLFGAEEKKPEESIEIRIVRYAHGDSSKNENRLLVVGQTAYRSVEELKKIISICSNRPAVHCVIYGTCFDSDPRLTSNEIAEIREACMKAGARFSYIPGG